MKIPKSLLIVIVAVLVVAGWHGYWNIRKYRSIADIKSALKDYSRNSNVQELSSCTGIWSYQLGAIKHYIVLKETRGIITGVDVIDPQKVLEYGNLLKTFEGLTNVTVDNLQLWGVVNGFRNEGDIHIQFNNALSISGESKGHITGNIQTCKFSNLDKYTITCLFTSNLMHGTINNEAQRISTVDGYSTNSQKKTTDIFAAGRIDELPPQIMQLSIYIDLFKENDLLTIINSPIQKDVKN